jgi:LysM repeat protein
MAQIRVNPGDSLWRIAKANPDPRQTVTERIRAIAAANGISDPNKIKPGQMLIIPDAQQVPLPRSRPPSEAPPRQTFAAPQQPGRGPNMRGDMPAASPAQPSYDDLAGNMTDRFGAGNVQKTPPTSEYAINRAPNGAGPTTPPVGNIGMDSPEIANALMTPDFSAANPSGTAGQVMNLPEDMNAAQFPSAGAETPTVDALNQQQVLTNMDPAQRQALLAALMGMQGPGM